MNFLKTSYYLVFYYRDKLKQRHRTKSWKRYLYYRILSLLLLLVLSLFCLYSFKYHCAKSIAIQSCCDPYFPVFGLNTEILYSTQIRKNTDLKNSVFWHFLHSVCFSYIKYNTRRKKFLNNSNIVSFFMENI